MRTRSPATPLLCILSLALLAGCHPDVDTRSASADDATYGPPCQPGAAQGGQVRIVVTFDAGNGGRPVVAPESCVVEGGTTVNFVTPGGDATEFGIRFKSASASLRTRPGIWVDSQPGNGRQRLTLTVDAQPGNYEYGIRANGIDVDPVIIVQNRN